jgi:hypothetical protein
MSDIDIKYFFIVLDMPSDDGQEWSKRVKANFCILLLDLLHFMRLTSNSCVNEELSVASVV